MAAAVAAAARRLERARQAAALGTAARDGSVGRNLVPPPSAPAPKGSKWMV